MSKETDELGIDPKKLAGLIDAGFAAPDVIGHVEGWRAWRVDRVPPRYGASPKLYSASYHYYWAPRQAARAECDRGCTSRPPDAPQEHTHIPGTNCSCGFYSAKTLSHLREMAYHTYDEEGPQITCLGQLALWGRVIEGRQGWRSEFAYPAVLFVPFEGWRLAKPLQMAYGVPVKLLNLLDPNSFPEEAQTVGDEGTTEDDTTEGSS